MENQISEQDIWSLSLGGRESPLEGCLQQGLQLDWETPRITVLLSSYNPASRGPMWLCVQEQFLLMIYKCLTYVQSVLLQQKLPRGVFGMLHSGC